MRASCIAETPRGSWRNSRFSVKRDLHVHSAVPNPELPIQIAGDVLDQWKRGGGKKLVIEKREKAGEVKFGIYLMEKYED